MSLMMMIDADDCFISNAFMMALVTQLAIPPGSVNEYQRKLGE